jgi:hypothetical protein
LRRQTYESTYVSFYCCLNDLLFSRSVNITYHSWVLSNLHPTAPLFNYPTTPQLGMRPSIPIRGQADEDGEPRNADKRRRLSSSTSHRTQPRIRQLSSFQSDLDNDEIWADQSFFSVGLTLPPPEFDASADSDFLEELFWPDQARERENWEQDVAALSRTSSNNIEPEILADILFPNVPDVAHRQVNLNLLNPFSEGSIGRYDKPRAILATTKEGEVNGYIKFRLQHTQAGFDEPTRLFGRSGFRQHHRQFPTTMWKTPGAIVPLLPPNFGRGLKLDTNDQKLLTFCMSTFPFCS